MYSGKVCIITGSAQGLGREFANRLLKDGASVTISDFNEEKGRLTLNDLASQFGKDKVNFVACDVTQDDQLENLFKESEKFFSAPVDIFVNNAGINTNLGWRKCMQVNIIAVMSATDMALSHMKGRTQCKIVNIASMAGIMPGSGPDSAPYFVSKRGVVSLSRTLAAHNGQGVDILCLCPAWADTEIVSGIREDLKPTIAASVKQLGLMKVEQVGEAFMTLLKSKNGTVLSVMANMPMLELGDYSWPRLITSQAIGKVLNRLFGLELVEVWQVMLTLVFVFLFLTSIMKMLLF